MTSKILKDIDKPFHNETDNIELNFTTSILEKDYIYFNFMFIYKKVFMKLVTALSVIIFPVSITIVVKNGFDGSITFAFFFSLFMLLLPIMLYYKSKKNYNNTDLFKEDKTYTINSDKILVESPSSTANLKWGNIKDVITTKKSVSLFLTPNSALVIPFRYLNQDQKLLLLSITKQKYVPKKSNSFLIKIIFYLFIFFLTVGIVQFIKYQP